MATTEKQSALGILSATTIALVVVSLLTSIVLYGERLMPSPMSHVPVASLQAPIGTTPDEPATVESTMPGPPAVAQVWGGSSAKKQIALTIDDGPHPTFTRQLLAVLKDADIKATFFLVGRNVEMCPDIAREIAAQGHELANHTYNHIRLSGEPDAVIEREIRFGEDAIRNATGVRPKLFRPPGGGYTTNIVQALQLRGQVMVQWSGNAHDATQTNGSNASPESVYHSVMLQVKPGLIMLMHEPSEGTLGALPRIISELKSQGYVFVTVGELLADPDCDVRTSDEVMQRGDFSPLDYQL